MRRFGLLMVFVCVFSSGCHAVGEVYGSYSMSTLDEAHRHGGSLQTRLAIQATDWACFLTLCKAGIRIAISKAMMAMTTSSSISVNPLRLRIAKPFPSCSLKT